MAMGGDKEEAGSTERVQDNFGELQLQVKSVGLPQTTGLLKIPYTITKGHT